MRPFEASDQFLRRVALPGQVKKNGIVRWKAFDDKDERLSLTFRDECLATDLGLNEYHAYYSSKFGKQLPAILYFTLVGLSKHISPPLEPIHDPVNSDDKYGQLHCSTSRPSREQMDILAKLVNDRVFAGIAFFYVAPAGSSSSIE